MPEPGRSPAETVQWGAAQNRVDEVCDEFEAALQRGEAPYLGAYLDSIPSVARETLFVELLLLELDYLIGRGEELSRESYLERYPEFASQIEAIEFKHGLLDTRSLRRSQTIRDRLTTGARVAHFLLVERLGAGAAGEVWKARDTRLERTVAIKIPHRRQMSDEERHRFLREGQAAAQLRHAAIVTVYEVGRDGGEIYIVSDFVDGADLRHRLANDSLLPRRAAEMCAEIAEGLHHAHECGVIHRDLKPANILLDAHDQPHISDFGLAKWEHDAHGMTLDGQLLGTPAYMSPEQARGESSRVDRRADVYALGAILYEMLTRQRPFDGDQVSVIRAVVNEEPKRPRLINPRIARDLETICLKALEKSPSARYPSAQEMAVDLRRFLRGEAIVARPAGKLERCWRWVKKRPAVATTFLLALIALGALSVAAVLAERNRQLLGLRTVLLTTDPPGAKVAFVPLDEVTGKPDPIRMVRPSSRTPLEVELAPADYFVVAMLDDGRFHEVYRRVPSEHQLRVNAYQHRNWRITSQGHVDLSAINIPDAGVTRDMALIRGNSGEGQEAWNVPDRGKTRWHVADFYIDCQEVTVAQWWAFFDSGPGDLRWRNSPPDHAVTLSFDRALQLAEKMGKRLPEDYELLFASTARGTSRWPWGNEDPPPEVHGTFGPVGTPEFDRLSTDRRVVGLMSNVAEWTVTPGRGVHEDEETADLGSEFASFKRVHGGDMAVVEGDASVTEERRNYKKVAVGRFDWKPGLGFRCVRSVRPRFMP
ncbi:MAG: protein kinase [Planctomycetales bacterium]|nr:protein kinase [Planctomycetales bacterium]